MNVNIWNKKTNKITRHDYYYFNLQKILVYFYGFRNTVSMKISTYNII